MASPTVAATNTSVDDNDNTDHVVSLPTGIVSGNLLIVVFALDGGNNNNVTFPAGWTGALLIELGSAIGLWWGWREADGTEGGTITCTTGFSRRSAHTAYRITGHEDPATQAPEASTGATGFDTAPNPDSLTPTGGAKDYLWLAGHAHDANKTTTVFPTNYSNGISTEGADAASAGVGSAERQLNAASENPGTFTISASEQWAAGTIAVHPAGAAGVNLAPLIHHYQQQGFM